MFFLQDWHEKSRYDSSLDVQDVFWFILLWIDGNTGYLLHHKIEGVPGKGGVRSHYSIK